MLGMTSDSELEGVRNEIADSTMTVKGLTSVAVFLRHLDEKSFCFMNCI
jgi:hypothetical protein